MGCLAKVQREREREKDDKEERHRRSILVQLSTKWCRIEQTKCERENEIEWGRSEKERERENFRVGFS